MGKALGEGCREGDGEGVRVRVKARVKMRVRLLYHITCCLPSLRVAQFDVHGVVLWVVNQEGGIYWVSNISVHMLTFVQQHTSGKAL